MRKNDKPDPETFVRFLFSQGIPLHPTRMLGSPTRSLEEVYDRLGNLSFPVTAEFKYEGQRAQIHAIRDTITTVLP